jgi:hypothetical protein
MGEIRNAYNSLIGKAEGKRSLRRPRHRRDDNSIMGLRKTGWEGVDWIHLTNDREEWWALVNTVMNLWVSYKSR